METKESRLAQHLHVPPAAMHSFFTPQVASATVKPTRSSNGWPQLAEWQFVRRLGGGNLTEVFQARPTATPHAPAAYVVKMCAELCVHPEAASRALSREAFVAQKVRNRHLAPILAARLSQSPQFIVAPFLEGTTLSDVLATGQTPCLPVALWIARQVAEGLDALSNAGWIHGDIKPGNIMVAPSGHVTLIDFGFAQPLENAADDHDAERPLLGTLSYLAPELLTSTLRTDVRSDLYSLGIVLYEMLTGRVPFSAGDPGELARQHREEKPQDLRLVVPHLPTRVARFVHALLAKDPLRRLGSPREAADRLAALEIETFSDRSLAVA